MLNIECYECTDIVSEWGEPICMGCFDRQKKIIKELKLELFTLKNKLEDLLNGNL